MGRGGRGRCKWNNWLWAAVCEGGHETTEIHLPLHLCRVHSEPLWHVDYFKLKTTKAQKTQKELFTPPYLALRIQKEGLVQEELLSSEITTKSKWDGCGKLWGAGRAYSSWDGVPLSLYLARQTCLSNNCSSHLPVNCIPCLWSPRLLAPCP